jgi:hypothetical protein
MAALHDALSGFGLADLPTRNTGEALRLSVPRRELVRWSLALAGAGLLCARILYGHPRPTPPGAVDPFATLLLSLIRAVDWACGSHVHLAQNLPRWWKMVPRHPGTVYLTDSAPLVLRRLPDGIALCLIPWLAWRIASNRTTGGAYHRYRVIRYAVRAVALCSEVRTATLEDRSAKLFLLHQQCRRVEYALRHPGAGTSRLSRSHGLKVAAALRSVRERMDADPDRALRLLVGMMTEINERYALGHTAALLPDALWADEWLARQEPAPSWWRRSIRMVLAIVCSATLIGLSGWLVPSGPFAVPVGTAVTALPFVLLYGPDLSLGPVVTVLSMLRGKS